MYHQGGMAAFSARDYTAIDANTSRNCQISLPSLPRYTSRGGTGNPYPKEKTMEIEERIKAVEVVALGMDPQVVADASTTLRDIVQRMRDERSG